MSTDTLAAYRDKIAKLLAKAERTDNEHEAEAFTAKAEALMLQYGIERAELQAAGKVDAEKIIEKAVDWSTIYAPTWGQFLYTLSHSWGDLTVLQSRYGKQAVRSYVIGHERDVEDFLTLMTSLQLQATTAMRRFRRDNKEERRAYTIHENFVTDRSFLEAYARACAGRLRDMRREVHEETTVTPGAALVLASKQDKVDEWVGQKYPKLGKARASRRSHSSRGAAAGHAAGQNANLGGKAVGGSRKAIR
jgi:hypothetical protein